MADKATKDWKFNLWLAIYEGENPREVDIDIQRFPDGKAWQTKTKKGKDCIYGLMNIPGTQKKLKFVAFERKSLTPIPQEKKEDMFDDSE